MLLSIDEVINMTPDQTIVLYGQSANVFDLPGNASSQGNKAAFTGWDGNQFPFFLKQGFWLVAPSTTGDSEPQSVKAAKAIFPGFEGQSMAYWPADVGNDPQFAVPAYKQGLVTTAFSYGPAPIVMQPGGTWIFVISPAGDMSVQLIQLLTYQSVQPDGELRVGPGTCLVGVNQIEWGPQFPNQEPPDARYALNTITWRLKPGAFDFQESLLTIQRPPGTTYYAPGDLPRSWGQAVSQTTLLSAASTPFDIDWRDDGGNASPAALTPSSPIFHLSVLAGSSLAFRRPWLQDYAANLISYTPSAASAWDDIVACCLLVCKIAADASGELPWPVGNIADYCFDEAMEHVDPGFDPPVPPWLQ